MLKVKQSAATLFFAGLIDQPQRTLVEQFEEKVAGAIQSGNLTLTEALSATFVYLTTQKQCKSRLHIKYKTVCMLVISLYGNLVTSNIMAMVQFA